MATKASQVTSSTTGDNCPTAHVLRTPLYNFTALEITLIVVCVILLVLLIIMLIMTCRKKRRRTQTETIKESNLEFQGNVYITDSASYMNISVDNEPLPDEVDVDEQHMTNRDSSAQHYQEIDCDLSESDDLRETSSTENYELNRLSSTGQVYQMIDVSDLGLEYISVLPPKTEYDGNNDQPEYLAIFPSIVTDDQEYVQPVDNNVLPPFPEHSTVLSNYNPELPEPPNNLDPFEQATGCEDDQNPNSVHNEVSSPNKDGVKSLEGIATNDSESSQNQVEDDNEYEDCNQQVVVPPCLLKPRVDHDEALLPDGTDIYDSMSPVYSVPNKYTRENTKQVIKQLLMSSIATNGEMPARDNQENVFKFDKDIFPKHVTIPRTFSGKAKQTTLDGEIPRERKGRAATFDEEYAKNADTTKVSSFVKSLEGMLEERRLENQKAFSQNQETSQNDQVEINCDYEQCEPHNDYEHIVSGSDEIEKDENENVVRPHSSIYESLREPLYEFVEREASSCDISEEQSSKDEVSRAVVRRLPSPYLERRQ